MLAFTRTVCIASLLVLAGHSWAAGKVEALVGTDGRIKVVGVDGKKIGTISAGLYEKGWRPGRRIPLMKQSGDHMILEPINTMCSFLIGDMLNNHKDDRLWHPRINP